jgi:hypothetical protein
MVKGHNKIKGDDMSGTCSMNLRSEECIQDFNMKSLKDQGVNGSY